MTRYEGQDGESGDSGFSRAVKTLEKVYLDALRLAILLCATFLIIYAAWLGIAGLYNVSLNEKSVVEKPVIVTTAEIADININQKQEESEKNSPDPADKYRKFYKSFLNNYFNLFHSKYEPYRQAADQPMSLQDFDQKYVSSSDRIAAVVRGELDFDTDKARLDALLAKMREVTALPETLTRLEKYRASARVKTTRIVSGVRPERYCSYYGYYINQCIVWGTRQVSYRNAIDEMRLPAGVISYSDLFKAYQDKYIQLSEDRKKQNYDDAVKKKSEIALKNIEGSANLWLALKIIGSFMVLMFLFLVIAIERHQRRIARDK